MTRAIIGMPLDMAMDSELSRMQFHARARALLADYDRLERECVIHKNTAAGANNQLNANRLETEKLAKDWLRAVEERDTLRTENDRFAEALEVAAGKSIAERDQLRAEVVRLREALTSLRSDFWLSCEDLPGEFEARASVGLADAALQESSQ